MISRVLLETLVVDDLASALAAFREELGLATTAPAPVAPSLAELWMSDAGLHPRFALARPPAAERGFLRLVQGPRADAGGSFHRPGLFNAELHSKDVDALHARLAGSAAFRPLCAPQTYDMAAAGGACSRSFATRGPGGAGVFFTTYLSVPPPRQLPKVDVPVGPMFNSAIATSERAPVETLYEHVLGMQRRLEGRLAQPSINRILGVPDDWGFLMLVYKGEGDGLVEIDVHEHPLPAARSVAPGELPPGNAILTLESPDLDAVFARACERGLVRSEPRAIAAAPYDGRRAGLLLGPAGERIELIEA